MCSAFVHWHIWAHKAMDRSSIFNHMRGNNVRTLDVVGLGNALMDVVKLLPDDGF